MVRELFSPPARSEELYCSVYVWQARQYPLLPTRGVVLPLLEAEL